MYATLTLHMPKFITGASSHLKFKKHNQSVTSTLFKLDESMHFIPLPVVSLPGPGHHDIFIYLLRELCSANIATWAAQRFTSHMEK